MEKNYRCHLLKYKGRSRVRQKHRKIIEERELTEMLDSYRSEELKEHLRNNQVSEDVICVFADKLGQEDISESQDLSESPKSVE